MPDTEWVKLWGPWGVVVLMLTYALRAVVKGDWTPGSYYVAMKSERDEARALAADAVKVSERLTAGWKP